MLLMDLIESGYSLVLQVSPPRSMRQTLHFHRDLLNEF
jgi:hypothetical protein